LHSTTAASLSVAYTHTSFYFTLKYFSNGIFLLVERLICQRMSLLNMFTSIWSAGNNLA